MPTAAFQTPLVERTLKAQSKLQVGDVALKWCFINVMLCSAFALQLGVLLITSIVSIPYTYITYAKYLEVSLSVVCGISAFLDLVTYATSRKFKDQLSALSPTQSVLLNIKNLAKPVINITSHSPANKCNTSVTSDPTTPPAGHTAAPITPHQLKPRRSHPLEPFTPPLNTSLTTQNIGNTLSTSLHSNSSFQSLSSINTSNISFTTPLRESESNSYTFTPSPKIRKTVSDMNNLKEYLKEYEDKEKWLTRGQSDRSISGGWAPRPTESLPPRPYFLAAQNQAVSVAGDTSFYNQQAADALIDRLGISSHQLDVWTENVRKWFAQTIFRHLVREIDTINSILEQLGSPECKVGSVSTAVLSKISANKHEHMPNIALLLPYLEVCVNQEYLVRRIQELAEGSCLGCFRWESGGKYKNTAWNKELPTDSQIVAHCLATYLDSHLPRNPMYPEGRTFTTQYFVRTPHKAGNKKKEYALFESSIHPPHFKLLVGEEVWEISKGRNNLFHAVILLLYYLRDEQHSMLGPVNMGPTGLNMMWIIQ